MQIRGHANKGTSYALTLFNMYGVPLISPYFLILPLILVSRL
jgi:hypothetical protein